MFVDMLMIIQKKKNFFLYKNPKCDTNIWNEQRDKSEMRKRVKQWTVIGVTDENFNFLNEIFDLVMPFKIKVINISSMYSLE